MYRFYQQVSQITRNKLFHPSFFRPTKTCSKRQRCNGKNGFSWRVTDQDAIQEILVLGGLKDYTCTKPEDCAVLRPKTSGRFLGSWDGEKICRSKIFLNIWPDERWIFFKWNKKGGGERMVPKTNTEFTLWKVEGKRTIYFPFWGSAKFDNLDHFAEHPVHFNQIFHFHKEPPCPNKIHQETKMAGKRNGHPLRISWCFGMISGEKRVYFFWVIHTVFDQELCSFSSYESPSSLPFPERKNKCMEMPQQQKKHPQQLIRKFKRVPFLKELLRFLAAYRAVEGFTREEWINCFFLWVSGKGGVLFFSQSFSGWLGVGGLGFQDLLLADFETLNDIYNFIRLTFSDKIITCTVSVYYSSFWKHLFLLTCQFVMTWNAWAFRTLIRNRMIPRKMPGTFKIHKSLQSEVTPPKNKHVPWKIVIGRLLCFWNGLFLRGNMLVLGGV